MAKSSLRFLSSTRARGASTAATPTVGSIDAFAAMMGRPDHESFVETARKDGTGVAVLATTGTLEGALAVPNRAPKKPHEIPVLLVEGAANKRITEDPISVDIDAHIEEGRSANVVARFGDGDSPLIIATPLSGWFNCAGERGTGIAVTLEIAKRLADSTPVLVVGTTGHELVDLGLQRLLGSRDFTPRAVLHVGACIAAMDAPGVLSMMRRCTTSVGSESTPALTSVLDAIDVVPKSVPRKDRPIRATGWAKRKSGARSECHWSR